MFKMMTFTYMLSIGLSLVKMVLFEICAKNNEISRMASMGKIND